MSKLPIIVFFLTLSCTQIYDWQTKYPDNLYEESIENFIERTTGYSVDLTPFSGDENELLKKGKK